MIDRKILNAVLCTVAEAGEIGAPCGVVYAALTTAGVTLADYQAVEAFLVEHRLVTKSGFTLRPAEKLTAAYGAARAREVTT